MENFIGLGLGVCIALMGAYMIATGDPRLLHSYHYVTTPVAELPALARETGAGLVGCGLSVAFIVPTFLPDLFTVLGVVMLVLSIAGMLASIVRHNGGLMTFSSRPGASRGILPGWGMRGRVAVCALIGAVCALIAIVPGIQMIVSGDVGALHDYHYANVAPADLPRLAAAEGVCLIALGVAIVVGMVGGAGMVGQRPAPLWSKVATGLCLALLCGGLAGMLGAIIYFNGSLMG